MIKPELLAPAGSMESLRAAVDNGADAVYLGIGSFNARANAQNFTIDDLQEAVDYTHLHSVRVYLTLNTLLRDDELSGALSLAQTSYEQGIDALIVQDLGLLHMLQSQLPYIPIHASTQMNLFDESSIEWAKESHISRVVLPRELSLTEITKRTQAAVSNGIEVEVFIHGALCVCYSGLCLFSAMNGNGLRSGNRGLCAQPCRTLFELRSNTGIEEAPDRLLSPRDQSALSFIKQLMEAGVHSLKIEGRMKEPAYVAATVRAYREYIDEIWSGAISSDVESRIQRHLLLAFNRGGSFTTQYMQGVKKPGLLSGEYSGRYGLELGIVVKKNARAGTLSLRLSSEELPIRGDYLSIRVKDKEICSFPIGKVEKMGDLLVVMGLHPQMIDKIPDGAFVFQMSELSYTRDLLQGKAAYKTTLSLHVRCASDPSKIILDLQVAKGMWNGLKASAEVSVDLDSSYPELSHSRISEQLSKAKSSPFDVLSVEIDTDFVLHAPVSLINELRRDGFMAMEQVILQHKHSSAILIDYQKSTLMPVAAPMLSSSSDVEDHPEKKSRDILHVNYYDLRRILPQKLGCRADYYSFSVYDVIHETVQDQLKSLLEEEPDAKLLVWLPGAYKDALLPIIDKAVNFMKQEFEGSYAGVVTSNPRNAEKAAWINAFANIYNHESLCTALAAGPFAVAPSYELKEQNLQEMLAGIPEKCFASTYLSLHRYGRIEWMQTEFCPVGKHEKACSKCRDKDRCYSIQILSPEDAEPVKGKDLPVITHAGVCTSEILGPLHISVSQDLLNTCKGKKIPVAHMARFLDEPYDVRRHIANDILSPLEE